MSGPDSAIRRCWSAVRSSPARLLEVPAVILVMTVVALRSISTDDIQLYDETAYLAAGLAIRDGQLPGFGGGASYADLYYLLSHLTTDPIGLYFAGRATSAVLLVLGAWIAARLLAGASLAWVGAAAVAVSPVPYIWPGVSAPAAGLVVVAIAASFRFPGPASIGVGAGLAWIAAASRPELAWAAVVWSVLAFVTLAGTLRTAPSHRRRTFLAVLTGAVGVPVTLIALHGSPFVSNGREWIAFQQHFSFRHATDGLDPWIDSGAITAQYFPGAKSVSEAITTDPGAFSSHVLSNLVDAPRILALDVLGLRPQTAFGLLSLTMGLIVGLSLVIAIGVDARGARRRGADLWVRLRTRSRWGAWIGLLAVLATTLISVMFVYPRQHYLLTVASLSVIALVALQHHVGSQRMTAVLPVAAAVVLFTLSAAQVARLSITRAAYPAPVAATVTRMIESGTDWRLLGGGQLLPVYVPRLTEVEGADPIPGERFGDMVDRLGISAILGGSTETSRWASMPGFDEFFSEPPAFGFDAPFAGSQIWLRTP